MSLAFGWTPQQIAALSLDELEVYLLPQAGGGTQWLTPEEARRRWRERRAQRDAWVQATVEAFDYGLSTT